MTNDKGLLDILRNCLGLEYLSDLKTFENKQQIAAVIDLIPAERYPLSVWQDATLYLTGERRGFATAEEARTFLLDNKA